MDFQKLCGWKPNYDGIRAVLNDPENKYPVFNVSARNVLDNYKTVDTFLYEPLLWANPNYRRAAQGIGDCVSFGAELACTLLTAKHAYKKRRKSAFKEAATESIYGGCRVEALGKSSGGWSDGAYGAAAATWVRKWGVLYREDYSQKTGNKEHNLSRYSSKKAKDWGNYGCGGQNDRGELDELAKGHPVKTISQMGSFDDVAAAIAGSKTPVTIASQYGTDMRRDRDGFCQWNGSWSHQMSLIAIRFDKPGALCAQSWGPNSASGPHYPESMPNNIRGFTWWIPERDVDRICRSGDCWAFGDIDGWRIDKADWSKAWGKL